MDNVRNRGFTLLELMVTVAIIAILTAIAIPFMESYRRRSYEASATHYMRSWVPAQELYRQVNGVYADSDEALSDDLGVLEVPTDIPYDFSVDSGGSETENWYGQAAPLIGDLAHLTIDQSGVVIKD